MKNYAAYTDGSEAASCITNPTLAVPIRATSKTRRVCGLMFKEMRHYFGAEEQPDD